MTDAVFQQGLDEQGLKLLKAGQVKTFNQLRRDNPYWKPDFTSANLAGVNLAEANLRGASLRETNLTGSDLRKENITGANIWGSKISKKNLETFLQAVRASCTLV